jgi:hypothetical protein
VLAPIEVAWYDWNVSFGRLLFGAILVGIGGVLLASQLGYLPPGVMPWFFQYWPALLVLFGLAFLANAMKNPVLGWIAAILALAAIGLGAWWLAQNKAAAGNAHTTSVQLDRPQVDAVTVRARTLGGKLTIRSATGSPGPGRRALDVSVRGVSAKDAEHRWNVGGRSGEFVWPKQPLLPRTAPFGGDVSLTAPEKTPIRVQTQSYLSGADLDFTRLRPERCDLSIVSGAARVRIGASAPERIALHGCVGGAEILLPPSGPVRVEFMNPLTARSLPEDFLEQVGGRGKAKIWISEGKGRPLRIVVDGVLLYVKIKRAPQSAG